VHNYQVDPGVVEEGQVEYSWVVSVDVDLQFVERQVFVEEGVEAAVAPLHDCLESGSALFFAVEPDAQSGFFREDADVLSELNPVAFEEQKILALALSEAVVGRAEVVDDEYFVAFPRQGNGFHGGGGVHEFGTVQPHVQQSHV